jgi:hypothetical protein
MQSATLAAAGLITVRSGIITQSHLSLTHSLTITQPLLYIPTLLYETCTAR